MWKYTGVTRPPFAEPAQPGQESVWDYPRPPRLERSHHTISVQADGTRIATSTAALRVCETAAPPTYYIPPQDIVTGALVAAAGSSFCEWKGAAVYWALADDDEGPPVAWSYPDPNEPFLPLRNCVGFYPGRVACFVGDERVHAQPGGFYGGWITADLAGPFKGETGSEWW